jgi:hypothetical protein
LRIILDISTSADNRIEGTASWVNGAKPVYFSGWLALMRIFELAHDGHADGAGLPEPSAVPGDHDPRAAGPSP